MKDSRRNEEERWALRLSRRTSGTSQNLPPWKSPQARLSASRSQTVSQSPLSPQPRDIPVVGYRMWTVKESFRVGIGANLGLFPQNDTFGEWKPGPNIAICRAHDFAIANQRPATHRVAESKCGCGFYVLTDLDAVPFTSHRHEVVAAPTVSFPTWSLSTSNFVPTTTTNPYAYPQVVGAVVGWGRVVQHGNEGWRAEKAQIIALLDCKVSPEHLELTHRVAERFGVPVLERSSLELLAHEFGDSLRMPT